MLFKDKTWIILLVVSIFESVQARSNGEVEEACLTMLPGHNNDPQTSQSPYTIVADADTYSGGETITVTISGGTFRGFFVQARRRYDDAMLGTFDIVDETNQQNRCDLVGSRCMFSSHDTVT